MADDSWLDVASSARLAGKSERQIRRWCEAGKLVHRMEKGAYLIEPASLEKLIAETSREEYDGGDAVSDDADGSRAESPSPSAPEPDPPSEADIPQSFPKANRTSDMDEDITPADIAALSEKLRTSKQTLQKSQEAMSETADLLFQRLCFENRRNRDMEGRLQAIVEELGIKPVLHSRRRKAVQRFKRLLPWILFGVSVATALLLWL